MRALVTGATGFVGSHLCEELMANHIEVWGTYRNEAGLGKPSGIRWLKMNLESDSAIQEPFPKFDFVFHLAGRLFGRTYRDFYRTNVLGTERLLRALDLHRTKVILFSSLAAGGPGHRTSQSASEPVSFYGRSKWESEKIAQSLHSEVLILRPPIIYGPRDRGMFTFFELVSRGWAPIFRNRKYSAIYVKDLCEWVLKLTLAPEKPPKGPLYLAHQEQLSAEQLMSSIAAALEASPTFLKIPDFALYAAKGALTVFNQWLKFKTGSLCADKVREILESQWTCDPHDTEIRAQFVAPTSFSLGAEMTAKWYRENKWL